MKGHGCIVAVPCFEGSGNATRTVAVPALRGAAVLTSMDDVVISSLFPVLKREAMLKRTVDFPCVEENGGIDA